MGSSIGVQRIVGHSGKDAHGRCTIGTQLASRSKRLDGVNGHDSCPVLVGIIWGAHVQLTTGNFVKLWTEI